ncbi:MAG TPA: type II secretion system F family protein [Patescibacteria group bacterium]|nr:type II secretion system F family protein [Patescibacteria group bacterium]
MPLYVYKARNQEGNFVTGKLSAPNVQAVQAMMRERNFILTQVKEDSVQRFLQHIHMLGEHVPSKDLVVFARQLSVLISATVPIVRALRILVKQTELKTFQRIISTIVEEVDGGARLSAAMRKHPHVFDDFFVYMIRAGETTGRLDEVLSYLADQKEKDYALVSRIISSLIYPAFILLVLFGIFTFMMIYVVPKLMDVVQSTGAALPLPTQIILGASNFFQKYWWTFIVFAFMAVIGYTIARRYPSGKHRIDQVKLHIPIIGMIFRKIYLARMSRSLANLLAAGVPVNKSLEIVSDIVNNTVYKNILSQAQLKVESGQTLSSTFAGHKEIPPMMTQMMDVGEETGRIDQILVKVSDFYTNEVVSLTNALVSLIEPLIIILLGLGALLLVSAVLMPIYSITSQF